jgi:hypothetical protein
VIALLLDNKGQSMKATYYPYFRGKQFELLSIRKFVEDFPGTIVCPIIEPVKDSFSAVKRTLDVIKRFHTPCIIIVNPKVGSPSYHNPNFQELLSEYSQVEDISFGFIIDGSQDDQDIENVLKTYSQEKISIIHRNNPHMNLTVSLPDLAFRNHVFVDPYNRLYSRKFPKDKRILLKEGFSKKDSNRMYPDMEIFSDMHILYNEEGAGFGDFLIVGDEYKEIGGPAYTVAIHLTYIDPAEDSVMMIRHFKSDRTETPTDPGGKYLEALTKLIEFIDSHEHIVYQSSAILEFRKQHEQSYFPGLGYVKRLSLTHHMEMLADFLQQ